MTISEEIRKLFSKIIKGFEAKELLKIRKELLQEKKRRKRKKKKEKEGLNPS